MALSFIYDPSKETPAGLASKRAVVQALMASQRAPRNVGEGLSALGDGIVENVLNSRIAAADAAGRASAADTLNGLAGGGTFPAAPSPDAASAASSGALPSVDVSKSASGSVDPQTVFAGLKARGLNDAQAYATLGNWKQESEFRPGAVNPAEGAIGFDQWRLERADALRNFAATGQFGGQQVGQAGRNVNDPEVQMDYYVNELKNHAGGNAFMAANDIPSANAALKTFIAYGSPYDKGGEGTRLANALAYQKLGFGAPANQNAASADPTGDGGSPALAFAATPNQVPIPPPMPGQPQANAAPAAPPVQTASLDPGIGLPPNSSPALDPGILAAASNAQSSDPGIVAAGPALPASAPIPTPSPNAGYVPGAPGATSPAGQRVLSTMMQQDPLSGPGGVVQALSAANPPAPASAPSPVAAALAGATQPQASAGPSPDVQKVAQAMSGNNLPVMAGGSSDAIPQGAQQQGPTVQQLMKAMSNPWLSPDQQQLVGSMLSARLTPHKIEMVSLGNGVTAEVDSMTGQIVGQIKGQPDLKSIKDAAGNEYMFNPADPTHPITADTLLGNQAGRGQAAQANGLPDPYASPFPRTIARTDVMKDCEGYLAQSRALGTPPVPFNDYQMNLKKQGAQSVVFNQENAANKAVGEAIGNNMADYINGAKDARTKVQALNMIKGVLDQYGGNISTGPGARTMLAGKQMLANAFPGTFGDQAGPTEMLQKLSTQLATADAKGLASRPTQFDFATYLKNNPGIQMSVAGQKALVNLKLQQAQHDYELGSMATHKQYANDPGGWADVVAQYDKDHPLINPLTNKPADPNATDFPDPTAAPQSAAPPVPGASKAPDGNWYVPDRARPGKYLKVVQ
ncbi:hypothetical protein FJ930_19765 [Mesorhizobium sp. B2-4-15]|uniref:phage tail tip lysozyme n=1 Tax=Mesorhizobium sp. B2-4-15 TaxID=2589934 RepID=UPI00114F75A2|nr:phage tail tip lysozyme [Mesorhizobium sp. B2-4-15]TPK70206.1 hypothetical protein FJ930_19765 [Mesorhizobium sp. B2-4-15]